MNDASVSAAQGRDAALRHQEWRADIDGKYFVPLFRCDLFDVRGFKDTRIIDEKVDVTEMLQDIFDRIFGVRGLAKIAFQGKALNTRGLNFFECLASFA